MEITRELLEERLAKLQADYQAHIGAIQATQWVLEQLETVTSTAGGPDDPAPPRTS